MSLPTIEGRAEEKKKKKKRKKRGMLPLQRIMRPSKQYCCSRGQRSDLTLDRLDPPRLYRLLAINLTFVELFGYGSNAGIVNEAAYFRKPFERNVTIFGLITLRGKRILTFEPFNWSI